MSEEHEPAGAPTMPPHTMPGDPAFPNALDPAHPEYMPVYANLLREFSDLPPAPPGGNWTLTK